MGFVEDQETLLWVRHLNAILYYETENSIYAIECKDEVLKWYKDGNPIIFSEGCTDDLQKKTELKEKHAKELFYSIFINYSLYAYNSVQLRKENLGASCWVDSLFHKNDAYQTPVVLNPMRDEGNIDVNREEFLSRQRLMSVFISSGSSADYSNRKINEKSVAVGYAYSLEKESKLLKKTIAEYFDWHKSDYCEWAGIKEIREGSETQVEMRLDQFLTFFNSLNPFVRKYRKVFEYVTGINAKVKNSTDLSHIRTSIYEYCTKRREKKIAPREINKLFNVLKNVNLRSLNYAQLYRTLVVITVWEILSEDKRTNIKGSTLNKLFEPDAHFIPRNAAKMYVLYKVISIMEKYAGMCTGGELYDKKCLIIEHSWPNKTLKADLKKDINKILSTKDYRTLKLWQTLNYLGRTEDDSYGPDVCQFRGLEYYDHFIDFEKLKANLRVRDASNLLYCLPCPIFEGDIILSDGHDYFEMSTLSSGMVQRLNTVGSLIYHLRNLNDRHLSKSLVEYSNINIILEEVELYFHPEYQKSYLKYLLEQMEHTNLSNIEGINLIFVTHSPFILSDVISSNILCLKGGNIQKKDGFDTFGANIHDLLRQPFFMENGTIGDYAQTIINKTVAILKVWDGIKHKITNWKEYCDDNIKNWDKYMPLTGCSIDIETFQAKYPESYVHDLISLIDEPLIRHSLLSQFERIFSDKDERTQRIAVLEQELKRLKGE